MGHFEVKGRLGWRRMAAGVVVLAGLAGLFWALRGRIHAAWPGSEKGYRQAERARATRRGLNFIIEFSRDPKVFDEWAADLLWCLYSIASTSSDRELSQTAWVAARERAAEYRRLYPAVTQDMGPDELVWLAHGSYTADLIGVRDDHIREDIRRAVARYTPEDFLWYDPAREPPPPDVPKTCSRCGHVNARGAKICSQCGAKLQMESRYDVWLDSLIDCYMGDRYGVRLGGHYADVIRWAPAMRPYDPNPKNPEFLSMVYTATHVVYTSNDYSHSRLSPRCLPDEFEFLKASLRAVIAMDDPETVGEFLDSLRGLGLTESDSLIRAGMDFVLRTQNPDGSWGDPKESVYSRYHSTWTAVDGLRDYRWTDGRCPPMGAGARSR